MWTNEIIFSEGDLCNTEEYEKFIQDEYQGNRSDRLDHVKNMIVRLSSEKHFLDESLSRHGHWNTGYFHDRVCSCCLHPDNDINEYAHDYCPNCGAIMDL